MAFFYVLQADVNGPSFHTIFNKTEQALKVCLSLQFQIMNASNPRSYLFTYSFNILIYSIFLLFLN